MLIIDETKKLNTYMSIFNDVLLSHSGNPSWFAKSHIPPSLLVRIILSLL